LIPNSVIITHLNPHSINSSYMVFIKLENYLPHNYDFVSLLLVKPL